MTAPLPSDTRRKSPWIQVRHLVPGMVFIDRTVTTKVVKVVVRQVNNREHRHYTHINAMQCWDSQTMVEVV